MQEFIKKVINGDCIEVMKTMPDNSIDLVVTSPPYNCGIKYDSYDDLKPIDEYWFWTEEWLQQVYRIIKPDGRVAINVPYEINIKDRGGRIMFMADFWGIMKKVGFKPFGMVDLNEDTPHRVKLTAWGSWMSSSSPYIYNPKECVILGYKNNHIKLNKGIPTWEGEVIEVEDEEGNKKNKITYKDSDKEEFKELVFGQWNYFADTKQLTKATFSLDIPSKAIKILTFKNDIVLDPFCGSGTSLCAAEILDRNWVGIEISENYSNVSRKRVQHFIDRKNQPELDFEKGV